MTFKTLEGDPVNTIDLRQTGANEFELITEFCFHPRDGRPPIRVPEGTETDLASVPSFLWWFVASYGRHTLPAVMHDHLVVKGMSFRDRSEADRLFLEALEDRHIGWWRRRIIWSAVTFATLFRCAWPLFLLSVLQVLAGLFALTVPLWSSAFGISPWLWTALPILASLLWWTRAPAIALATYVGPFLAPACISVLVTILVSSIPNVVRKIFGVLPKDVPVIVTPHRVPWP